jgi:uncharacterized SAM-binding protein YcdF (DUF218 family)
MGPSESQDQGPRSIPNANRRFWRAVWWLLGAAFLLAIFCFLFVGDWLVSEDPLQKADAIAVLSGAMPLRALEAAKLYREGYAPEVWLTHPDGPAEKLQSLGIPYTGEDAYNQQILEHQGIPAGTIEILDPSIRNTADEITVISDFLARNSSQTQTVIIVTSKVHTRRAGILWRRLAPRRLHAVIRGASDDPFRPSRWWATTTDALDVVREVLGTLNAWAGLPMHAAE